MAWKETNVVNERVKFIEQMLKGEIPFVQLCKQFEISEKTGYKWRARFMSNGYEGLLDMSKAPINQKTLSEDVVIEIICLKTAHLSWGPKKILELYKVKHKQSSLSLSSVQRILNKANLVKPKKVKRVKNDECSRLRQHIQPKAANDVWAVDFKGWWWSSGEKCVPLTIRDLTSRFIIEIRLMVKMDTAAVKQVFMDAFRKYGLPKVIRSDNGVPFASTHGILSLTQLSAWWITLGIMPDRTDKGTPGQNGSLERMHADIAREVQGKHNGGIAVNQVILDAWRDEYNNIRPNEAIDMKTPGELYQKSEREYKGDFDIIVYPLGYTPRKVVGTGEICIDGCRISISHALRGLTVGLLPTDTKYKVFLADFYLGEIDMNLCCFVPHEGV